MKYVLAIAVTILLCAAFGLHATSTIDAASVATTSSVDGGIPAELAAPVNLSFGCSPSECEICNFNGLRCDVTDTGECECVKWEIEEN